MNGQDMEICDWMIGGIWEEEGQITEMTADSKRVENRMGHRESLPDWTYAKLPGYSKPWWNFSVTVARFLSSLPERDFLLLSARSGRVHAQQHGSGLAGAGAEVSGGARGGAAGGAEGAGAGPASGHRAALPQGEDGDPQLGSESSLHPPQLRGLEPHGESHLRATSFTRIIQPGNRSPEHTALQSITNPS